MPCPARVHMPTMVSPSPPSFPVDHGGFRVIRAPPLRFVVGLGIPLSLPWFTVRLKFRVRFQGFLTPPLRFVVDASQVNPKNSTPPECSHHAVPGEVEVETSHIPSRILTSSIGRSKSTSGGRGGGRGKGGDDDLGWPGPLVSVVSADPYAHEKPCESYLTLSLLRNFPGA